MALEPNSRRATALEAALERRAHRCARASATPRRCSAAASSARLPPAALGRAAWTATVEPAVELSCVLALAGGSRVHFSVGPGYTVPTELAFIPLAFALPPALLAPCTAAAGG